MEALNQNKWMLWDQMTELFIEQEQQKNYCIYNNKLKEQEKEIIEHILWCYTQIKNPTFFDVIPILWCYTQIKNPKHPLQNDRDNWLEVDQRKRSGSEVDQRLETAGGSVMSSFDGGDVDDESGRRW